MDPIFAEEQQHLIETYDKLLEIRAQTQTKLQEIEAQASKDKSDMSSELALDMTSDDMSMEMYADLEAMNQIIDNYSRSLRIGNDKLAQLNFLLQQPYFAKIRLKIKPEEPARDIYLGASGIVDEKCRHFIVDWRSPVAETYYNQENGATSYKANGKIVHCELILRRQFDLIRNKLNAYFDTTIAIEDPVLLASLAKNRTSQLKNITATIQREQNQIIRHDDVEALLVNGIAGSGKTSVLLQRIAYLFYTQREKLRPDQVYLISPNPIFQTYIDNVLPDMGERNPHCITWKEFIEDLGLSGRPNEESGREAFDIIDAKAPTYRFKGSDFRNLTIGDEVVIKASQIQSCMNKLKNVRPGPRLAGLMETELLDKLEARIKRLAKKEQIHDEMMDLDVYDQVRIFGSAAQPSTDKEYEHLATLYLQDRYQPLETMIERADWLHVDRIGESILGVSNLSTCEWLYLKMALTGCGNRDARYVMIDEVQDYTQGQLMVMARWFKNARFMLLGDQNQAIKNETSTFEQVKTIFTEARGCISVCELMTSYRSSPEITNLFTSLMDEREKVKVHSVQASGTKPLVHEFDEYEVEDYLRAIRDALPNEAETGLCAIITRDKQRAKWLSKVLEDNSINLIVKNRKLPDRGVIIIPLPLAKGLEFDEVIIPDAQETCYPNTTLSKHQLYTAISRATKRVSIFTQGPLSPLLRK